MRYFCAIALILGLSQGCAKKDDVPAGTARDFTRFDLVQFKAATGIGVSGTRYDLTLADKTVKKYNFSADNGYQPEVSVTMNEAVKSSLVIKLKSVPVGSYGQCSTKVCAAGRASIWVEIPNVTPPIYVFSNEGDCICPDDGENAPSLQYAAMSAIYKDVLALFTK